MKLKCFEDHFIINDEKFVFGKFDKKEFLEKYKDEIDWVEVSKNPKLSENFIREFQDEVHWDLICMSQDFSQEFINEFISKLWICATKLQETAEKVMREMGRL